MRLVTIRELPREFDLLVGTADAEGHSFMSKMSAEWASGENRFNRSGEILFAVYKNDSELVAVGGLNIDPYANNPTIGRVRHVFVRPSERRSGAGKLILENIFKHAKSHFKMLRLKTHNPDSVAFYESLGFNRKENAEDPSHIYFELSVAD